MTKNNRLPPIAAGLGLYVLGAIVCARSGALSLTFDGDLVGAPPQGVYSTGIGASSSVKVSQDGIRNAEDLSVAFTWNDDREQPRLELQAPAGGFPAAGSLIFDLVARNNPIRGAFHVKGLTSEAREAFHFLVRADGMAALRTAAGDIPFATYIPNQWYIQRLDYNLTDGVYAIMLDSFWASGDRATITLDPGETLEKIVFEGRGPEPSSYGLDTVHLLKAPGQRGRTDRLGTLRRKIRWEVPLAGPIPTVIVYPSDMPGGWAAAQALRDGLEAHHGVRLACVSDRTVTASDTWLIRNEYLEVPMIVLGNAADNRALYAISTRFLSRSNHRWPGGDRFCNRTLLEPFRRDVNYVLLEASTADGLRAGVDAFLERAAGLNDPELTVPHFRDLGAATGRWAERPFRIAGIDLSPSVEDIKAQLIEKHGASVPIRGGGLYFYSAWQWLDGFSIDAAKYAAAVLLLYLERLEPDRFHGGHYNFDRTFKAWQICFTSGVVSEDLINRVEAAMARQAAYPRDYHASSLRNHDGMRIARYANRHMVSSLANYLCGTDYVLSHCRLNPTTREMITTYDRAYRRIARRFLDSYRDNNVTSETGDSAICVLNLMALTGNLEFMRNGTLDRSVDFLMASVNNLGYYTGEGPYIGSYNVTSRMTGRSLATAAAFYHRDPAYNWVARNIRMNACNVAHENPVFDNMEAEQIPSQYLGVYSLPFDDRIYRAFETPERMSDSWGAMKSVPTGLPIEQLYDRVVFRDGFDPQDAFLKMISTQLISSHQMLHSNAIIQYTDLGKLLLFTHSQLTDGWVRNVLSASNGKPAAPTFASRRKAMLNTDRVTAFASVAPNNGNTEWTRTLVHRRGHYFVALDRAKTLQDGDYNFTCRWRTLYPQTLADGICTVEAGDGVTMEIISADPVHQHSEHREPDGTMRPYLLSQYRQATLDKGESVHFNNLFYARGPDRPDTCRIRSAGATCVMVQGRGKDWEELALIGTGTSPAALQSITIDADIFYVTGQEIVAANCRQLEIMGVSVLTDDRNETVEYTVDEAEVGHELARLFESLPPPADVAPAATPEQGFTVEWTYAALEYPQGRHPVARISATPSPQGYPIESLTDDLNRLGLLKPHQMPNWRTPGQPVEITLDLGNIREIDEIQLAGPIEVHYTRRYYYSSADDVRFSVTYSNDDFTEDIRAEPDPMVEFRDQTFPNAQYTWAGRVPLFAIAAGVKARFVRIRAVTDKPHLAFQRLEVLGTEREPELFSELQAADLNGDGFDELVGKTSNSEIFALDAAGHKLWSRMLPGVITAWNAVDLETDGTQEVLVYTTEDAAYALENDGEIRWRVDFHEYSKQQAPEAWERDWSKYSLSFVTAWRPDPETGLKELFGYGHTTISRIHPDLSIDSRITDGYVNRFAVSDRTVLDEEVLATGGFRFTLIDRDGETKVNLPMPGKLAGNGQLPVFVAVAPIRTPALRGFLSMNISSLLWAPADAWNQGWKLFSDVPLTAYALADLTGDGCVELVVGGQDGFLRVYRIADGTLLSVVSSGPAPITGLVALRDGRLVAASNMGVTAFDKDLRQRAYANLQATDLALLRRPDGDLLCVSDRQGRLYGLSLGPGHRP